MSDLSRRAFLRKAAADTVVGGLIASAVGELRANPLGLPIGSQTWPHRARLKKDFPGLMKELAGLGIQRIELCSPFSYAEFAGLAKGTDVKRVLSDHGLTCESAHFDMKELRQDQAASIAWAKDVCRRRQRQHRLEESLHRRKNRRREELLHRAGHGHDEGCRRVS